MFIRVNVLSNFLHLSCEYKLVNIWQDIIYPCCHEKDNYLCNWHCKTWTCRISNSILKVKWNQTVAFRISHSPTKLKVIIFTQRKCKCGDQKNEEHANYQGLYPSVSKTFKIVQLETFGHWICQRIKQIHRGTRIWESFYSRKLRVSLISKLQEFIHHTRDLSRIIFLLRLYNSLFVLLQDWWNHPSIF